MFKELIAKHRRYFESGKTRCLSWREGQLRALEAMFSENKNEFYQALWKDLRRNEVDANLGDVACVIKKARYAIKHLRGWAKAQKIKTPSEFFPNRARVQFEPRGLVLILGTWNYPFFVTALPLISAISAGNTAVIKFSDQSLHSAELFQRLVSKYLDADAFSVVSGGIDVSSELLSFEWDHICYTGGEKGGKIVYEAAAKNLTPVILELGGKNGVVVHSSANLSVAANRIAQGAFINAGQTCTRPDYVLVYNDVYEPFLEALKKAVVHFYGADPKKSEDFGRIVNAGHFDRISRLIAKERIFHGGQSDPTELFIGPTILVDVGADSAVMQEEIFGPVLPVLKIENGGNAVDQIRKLPAPLALYLFGKEKELGDLVISETQSGCVVINDCAIQGMFPEFPFGGVGRSGMGTYFGKWGFMNYSYLRGVIECSTLFDPSFRYPPYSKGKFFRKFIT